MVFPTIVPEVAEIVVLPAPMDVAIPVDPMVATAVFRERQVTELVRFFVVPLEYVPIAVNCTAPPSDTEGFAGLTVILTSVTLIADERP